MEEQQEKIDNNKKVESQAPKEKSVDSGSGCDDDAVKKYLPYVVLVLGALVVIVGVSYFMSAAKIDGDDANKTTTTTSSNKVLTHNLADKDVDEAGDVEDNDKVADEGVQGAEDEQLDEIIGEIEEDIENLDVDEDFADFDTEEFGF